MPPPLRTPNPPHSPCTTRSPRCASSRGCTTSLPSRPRCATARLAHVLLPALAQLNDGQTVVLAQCDGQRVLFLPPEGQLTIEPLDAFAARWGGRLLLFASRASLAGELVKCWSTRPANYQTALAPVISANWQ